MPELVTGVSRLNLKLPLQSGHCPASHSLFCQSPSTGLQYFHFKSDLPTCLWNIDSRLTVKDFGGWDKWVNVSPGLWYGLDTEVRSEGCCLHCCATTMIEWTFSKQEICHLIMDAWSCCCCCCGSYIPFQVNKLTHNPAFAVIVLTEFLSIWLSYWKDHATEEVNTHMHAFLGKTFSFLSGKCVSSCQHFCSLLDWALCSAVTPLQEASSPRNSCAICPGSRLATSIPTHPCLSSSGLWIVLCVPGLEHVPGIRGELALFIRM